MQSRLVPIDLLFVTAEGIGDATPDRPLLPVVSHGPMMALFRYLIHGNGSLTTYWQWNVASHQGSGFNQEAHLAEWRRRIRRLRWLPLGPRPVVSHLTRDRLVLESGVEQACLAKALGRRWMRVQMPDEVRELWDSRSTSKLEAVVKETGRKVFYNPVLHARYRRARVARPDSIRLDRIRRLLGDCGEGLRGLDIGCNMGYMSHMFQRQGFRMTGVDFNESHLKVAMALDDTYSLDVEFFNCRFEELEAADSYDVVIMLTVFYHTLKRSESEAATMISRLDGQGSQALFWESGEQPQREIDFIRTHSGFTEYLSLGPTFGTSLRRELGVFLRPSTILSERFLGQYKTELAGEFASSPHTGEFA